MKIVQSGYNFRPHNDGMIVHDQLPANAYLVCYDQQTGPYLEKYADIEVKEKVYGVHDAKVNKVLNAFECFDRNLGVILSGDKGIGKSLFSKMLSEAAIAKGYPLLVINGYFPGIAEFVNTIEQEVLVLFDEFDKTFSYRGDDHPQVEMLSLFDGVAQGKKLFVVTCNRLEKLNEFLVNRPGRFHYHFRFEYPTAAEITAYLEDKLDPSYYGEITKVVTFAHRVNLNYDCLRAIAFELNCGLAFEDAIKDLNIVNINQSRYHLTLQMKNGRTLTRHHVALDTFSDDLCRLEMGNLPEYQHEILEIEFIPSRLTWNNNQLCNIIKGDTISRDLGWYFQDDWDGVQRKIKNSEPLNTNDELIVKLHEDFVEGDIDFLKVERILPRGLHYEI